VNLMAAYRERAAVLRAVAEVATYDATVRDLWNGGLARFMDHTVRQIRDQQDAGLTPTDIDAVSAGRVIIAGGERAFFDHITVGDPGDDAALARDQALTWWHGIYRRPAVSGIP
jgi:hypothetical protein